MNRIVLLVFAPALIVTGGLGFVVPAGKSIVSGTSAYNVFHIVFGAVGVLLVRAKRDGLIRTFNIGFGVLDLYQALASVAHLFPERFFRWTPADDVLHVVLGAGLIIVGVFGRGRPRP